MINNYDKLRNMLKDADETLINKIEATNPFKDKESLVLYILAHIIDSPSKLSETFGVSKQVANWVCSNLVGELVVPNLK